MTDPVPVAPTDTATPAAPTAWHTLTIAEVETRLTTHADQGLTRAEAERRLLEHGPNRLERKGGPRPLVMLLRQFAEPLMILLMVAAAISALTHEVTDAAVIAVIVVLNAVLGFSQEYRAQRALEALRKLSEPTARVIREGEPQEVAAEEVVPGEVLVLEAGMRVVADARLVEVASLQADEAPLTGEAYPVDKHVAPVAGHDAPLGDRTSMVYAGTAVTRGRGRALVAETGMGTQLGKIAALLQEQEEQSTPLQRRLSHVGTVLAAVAVAICAVVFVAGILREHELREMFLVAIALAVAAVPEGLPAVITISLALGAQQMVRRNALIRRLPAVETLGSVTVIATDKTGTLTEGAMRPAELYTVEGARRYRHGRWEGEHDLPSANLLLQMMALCNDAYLPLTGAGEPDWEKALGDPTEVALLAAALAAGVQLAELASSSPRRGEIPFDADRKRMTTVHARLEGAPTEARYVGVVKGAPDQVLELCVRYVAEGREQPLTPEVRERIAERYRDWSRHGLRVLGAAYRPLEEAQEEPPAEEVERELVFVGLVALADPPRREVAAAMRRARDAGIRTVMVTGDYAATGASIAQEVGLCEEGHCVLEGRDMEDLTVEALAERVEGIDVYARVSPEHKVRVVDAWRRRGEVVAVTGDGVNDAAALQRADIGVAMGIAGTEVAKDAADMVLLDDNYATIVAAVEQGRVIYDNIRKFIRYLLATNVGEIWTIFGSLLLGWPLPVVPVMILWINLVTDGLPALALGFEPAEGDVMRRRPRAPRESLFARGLGVNVLAVGLLMGIITLSLFYWRATQEIPGLTLFNWLNQATEEQLRGPRTLAFFVLAALQMAHVMSVRRERESSVGRVVWTNPYLLAAVGLTLVGQFAVTYVPALQGVFNTEALSLKDLEYVLGACVVFFICVEGAKWVEMAWERRRERGR